MRIFRLSIYFFLIVFLFYLHFFHIPHGFSQRKFLEKIHHPPKWVEEEIALSFAPFEEKKISQKALHTTFSCSSENDPKTSLARFRILDHHIFQKTHPSLNPSLLERAKEFGKDLLLLQKEILLPNVDLLICTMDGIPEVYVASDFYFSESWDLQAPILAQAKKGSAKGVVLVPDFNSFSYWGELSSQILRRNISLPWEEKRAMAFWRGTSSDKGYTQENYTQKPRYILSHLSTEHPYLIDAGFNDAYPKEIKELFKELGVLKASASHKSHLRCKYLPVLDGWVATYPGYLWRLLSHSVCFKQTSEDSQWFYRALQPFVHYVPINNDMSDLIEKILWAKTHDEECKQIAKNASQWVRENLMIEDLYAFLYLVLKKEASLEEINAIALLEETRKDPSWKEIFP
jgi:hypothetical protein